MSSSRQCPLYVRPTDGDVRVEAEVVPSVGGHGDLDPADGSHARGGAAGLHGVPVVYGVRHVVPEPTRDAVSREAGCRDVHVVPAQHTARRRADGQWPGRARWGRGGEKIGSGCWGLIQ